MRAKHRAWLAALLLSGCSDDTGPGVTFRTETTDPAGDGGLADLVFASYEVTGSTVRLRVEFGGGTFHADSILAEFNLDIDGLESTGQTTTNPGHAGMGIDCLIELGKYTASSRGVRVRMWDGTGFIPSHTGEITVLSSGYEATVPLSGCMYDGTTLFRLGSFRQLNDVQFTTRQDWLPDPALPPVAAR